MKAISLSIINTVTCYYWINRNWEKTYYDQIFTLGSLKTCCNIFKNYLIRIMLMLSLWKNLVWKTLVEILKWCSFKLSFSAFFFLINEIYTNYNQIKPIIFIKLRCSNKFLAIITHCIMYIDGLFNANIWIIY